MSDKETNGTTPENTEAISSAPLSPGARLAAAREEHGWTVEQVAAHLKLAPRQVVALERDDYAALPGMPIVRGFVRSYAKLLKMDPAPLLAQLGGETVANEPLKPKESLSTPFSEARLPSMGDKPAISSKWMTGVLILLLIIAALWALQVGGGMFGAARQEVAPAEQTQAIPSAADSVVEPLAPPIETLPARDSPDEPLQSGVPVESPGAPAVAAPAPATEPQAPPVTQVEPAPPVAPVAPVVNAPGQPAASANVLNLSVREESWIEIRREGSGRTVLARLAQPGENISVEVGEPTVLIVGNAAGVDATLRGEPVELRGSTRTNVARLTLK